MKKVAGLFSPTKAIDYREAEIELKLWLKVRGIKLIEGKEWAYWNFNNRPFWSVWALLFGEKIDYGLYGFQIYDDGEILLITSLGSSLDE